MATELIYRLNDPGYTIYHRAALGGLAATVQAWSPPAGIETSVERDQVKLTWDDALTDQEAIRRILAAAFRRTDDKLIDLPGHAIPPGDGSLGLRLAIHNGLCATFLQHNKMRPSEEKKARQVALTGADGAAPQLFTYKPVDGYAHQRAQGTGLLEPPKKPALPGTLPAIATIPQSVVPGAMSGVQALEACAKDVLLLLFLMVGSSVFLLRPRASREKMQACIVVPDVKDLVRFARAMHTIVAAGRQVKTFTNSYLGRVVGGAEEAALRLLVDLTAEDLGEERSIGGLHVIAMGKVAWDKNQINRSGSVRIGVAYEELGIFRAALQYLGKSKILHSVKGEGFAVPESPVPELVAANLTAERHWAAHFHALVADKKDFYHMRFAQKGLHQMKEAIKNDDDRAVIDAFHDAWRMTMGEMGDRARREGIDFTRLVEVRREKIRNEILRTKTADALAGWFLRFCADATKGGTLGSIRARAPQLREFLFNPRNTARLQNLLLFALVSYAGEGSKSQSNGDA